MYLILPILGRNIPQEIWNTVTQPTTPRFIWLYYTGLPCRNYRNDFYATRPSVRYEVSSI